MKSPRFTASFYKFSNYLHPFFEYDMIFFVQNYLVDFKGIVLTLILQSELLGSSQYHLKLNANQ